jgi:hypothetical protein
MGNLNICLELPIFRGLKFLNVPDNSILDHFEEAPNDSGKYMSLDCSKHPMLDNCYKT